MNLFLLAFGHHFLSRIVFLGWFFSDMFVVVWFNRFREKGERFALVVMLYRWSILERMVIVTFVTRNYVLLIIHDYYTQEFSSDECLFILDILYYHVALFIGHLVNVLEF